MSRDTRCEVHDLLMGDGKCSCPTVPKRKAHSLHRAGSADPDKCPVCRERRVPQYDIELKMAEAALNDWQIVARNLYKVMSLRKTELRRVTAENAYTKLARDYNVE